MKKNAFLKKQCVKPPNNVKISEINVQVSEVLNTQVFSNVGEG